MVKNQATLQNEPVVKQELINQDNEQDTLLNVLPTTQHDVIPNTMWNHHPQCVNWNGFHQMPGTAPINPLTMGLQIPIAGVANNHLPVGYPVGTGHLELQPLLAQPAQPPLNKHHHHMNELFNGMSSLNNKQQLFYQKKIGELTEHIKQCDVFSKLQEQNFQQVEQLRHNAYGKIDQLENQLQSSNTNHLNTLHEKDALINHLTDEIRKNSAMKPGFEKEKREWIQEKALLVKEKTTLSQEKMNAEVAQKQLEIEKKEEIQKLKKKYADKMKVTKENHKKEIDRMKANFEKQAIASPRKNSKQQKQIEDLLKNRDATKNKIKTWLQFRVPLDEADKHSGSETKSHQHKRRSRRCHETSANKKFKVDATEDSD